MYNNHVLRVASFPRNIISKGATKRRMEGSIIRAPIPRTGKPEEKDTVECQHGGKKKNKIINRAYPENLIHSFLRPPLSPIHHLACVADPTRVSITPDPVTLIRRYLSYRATEYKRDSAYNPGRRLLIQSWQEKRGWGGVRKGEGGGGGEVSVCLRLPCAPCIPYIPQKTLQLNQV